jgi:branched-chain amino acid aminotransferase
VSTGSLASLDGVITPASEALIPATDQGLLRGDGAFEVVRVYEGHPFAFERHMARLERSAGNLRLPIDLERVRAESHRLLAEAGPGPAHELLRIVVTRGGRRLLLTEPLPAMPDAARLASITYSPTRVLDGIKSLSYAANMLAGRLAKERGFDEALLVTPHGRVLEGPTSTFLAVLDGRLVTPPLDEHLLDSITRRRVLETVDVDERAVTVDELRSVKGAALVSTTREVQPVHHIEDIELDVNDALIREAMERVRDAIAAAL